MAGICSSKKNVLFDLSRGHLVFCNHFENLKRNQYKPNCFTKVPFNYTKEGVVFDVTTEFGIKKFILDSGATNSLIRPSKSVQATCFWKQLPAVEFSEFSLCQIHLGKRKLLLLDIASEMEFDGILGVDFLAEYVVFLDFSKHVAYIGNAHDVCN